MDRTIPPISHFERSEGVDILARPRHDSTQQPDQHHHRTLAQPNPLWIQPHAQLRQSAANPQRLSRIANTNHDQESRGRHTSAQQGCKSEGTTPGAVSSPRTSLARRVPPETPASEGQAYSEASRPVQNHPGNISGSLQTRITPELENPQRVPRIP